MPVSGSPNSTLRALIHNPMSLILPSDINPPPVPAAHQSWPHRPSTTSPTPPPHRNCPPLHSQASIMPSAPLLTLHPPISLTQPTNPTLRTSPPPPGDHDPTNVTQDRTFPVDQAPYQPQQPPHSHKTKTPFPLSLSLLTPRISHCRCCLLPLN